MYARLSPWKLDANLNAEEAIEGSALSCAPILGLQEFWALAPSPLSHPHLSVPASAFF